MLVRRSGRTASESKVCSKGTNKLTSLAVGFNVPTSAMTKSGQNLVSKAYPIPESTINIVPAVRSGTARRRRAIRPMARVIIAGPQQHRGREHANLEGADPKASQVN